MAPLEPGSRQPGRIIARELGHLTDAELATLTLYLTKALTQRLGITSARYRCGGGLEMRRALSRERATGAALSIIKRLRARGGTL